MRERLLEALDESEFIEHDVSKRGFLVYLMGPYKSYPPYDPPPPEVEGVATTRPTLDEIDERLTTDEFRRYDDLYRAVRAHLRALAWPNDIYIRVVYR